jgi:hypothetical protein
MSEEELLLPNVLLGDVFVLVMNRTAEEIASEVNSTIVPRTELSSTSSGPSLKVRVGPPPVPKKESLPPLVSKESTRLFMSNTYPVGTYAGWGGSVIPVSCDACGIPIRRSSTYVRCSECVSPLVDLCVACFANGAEFASHSRHHSYAVVKAKISNRKLVKLDIFDYLSFLKRSAEKGNLNFSDFENTVLHAHDNGVVTTSGRRFGGRGGVRATSEESVAVSLPVVPSSPPKQTTDAEKIYLSIINMLTGCREELSVEELVKSIVEQTGNLLPGPANYNILRDEFEFEYLPEAETIVAALAAPIDDASVSSLAPLMEAYNGILDERERRKRTLVSANLTSVKEFTLTGSSKKRKTDEKDIFEKCRIFIKPVSESLDKKKSSESLKFIDQLATHVTTRKRLIERLKRLVTLRKHGVFAEDQTAIQFDLDRKKRNDLASGTQKLWTFLPSQTDIGGNIARTSRGHLVHENSESKKISPLQIFQTLPGGDLITDGVAVQICLDYYIAPQHFFVVQSAIHTVLSKRSVVDEEFLRSLIKDGIFGTTKRYIQGGGGPGGGVNASSTSLGDMKNNIIKYCRDSFSNHR